MKQVLVNITEYTFLLLVIFLFYGEPDVFDSLRAKVMGTTVECVKPNSEPSDTPQMK